MADGIEVSPVVLASDTVDAQTSPISRLGDAVTKGIGAAAISGTLSIYNTFLDYQGKEAIETEEAIRKYDQAWGDYYAQHSDAIDLAGFVGTGFGVGGLGIRGLKLARSGEALGPISRALNLAPSRKQLAFENAMRELARSGGSATSAVAQAKRAQLGWSLADQTLTSAAAELAIVGTMNDSPIFEGDDAWDFAKNVAVGALFGGAVGGLLEHWGTRGILKQAQGKIESNRRLFDTVFDPVKLGLSKSDETLLFAENILKLPDDFFQTNFTYKMDGVKKTFVLDTADAFKSIKTRAEKVALDNLSLKFNELAEGGEITGQAMFEFIVKRIKDGKSAGKSADSLADEIQGYLQGVKKIGAVSDELAEVPAPKQFFVNLKPKGLDDLFSEVRGKDTGKVAYYLAGDMANLKFGSVARLGVDSADEAFDLGYDAVVTAAGHISVNPKSQIIKKTPDAALTNKFYVDLETGSLSPETVVVGADLMKKADDFKAYADKVFIGKKEFVQAASKAADLKDSALLASSRYMWASTLKESAFKGRVIEWNDFALLDRVRSLSDGILNTDAVKIKLADGRLLALSDIVSVPEFVNQLKLEFLQEALNKGIKGYDLRHISAHINQSRAWIESAIQNNFQPNKQLLTELRDISTYFRPQSLEIEWDMTVKQAVQTGAAMGPNHMASTVLGHHYALLTRMREQDNAFRSVLGEDADRFLDAPTDLAQDVSERGAGAGSFSSSNADYGRRAELHVQDTGKHTALVSQKLRDQTVGALAPQINAVRDSVDASAELGILTTALRRDARKYYLDTESNRLVDREAMKLVEAGTFDDLDSAVDYIKTQGHRGEYVVQNQQVVDFLAASRQINAERLGKQTTLLNAMGIARNLDDQVIYVPPVDTRRYPFFAFVVAKERIGASTDLAMITARTDDQLRQLAGKVGDEYEVIFKNDTAKFFKAKGQYDYQMQINDSKVNSDLQRRGILGDFFPETRAENVLEDYVRWHGNASENLVRTAVQVKNRQFFSELNFLSEQFQAASISAARHTSILKKNIQDPFQDYIKTALNISKQGEYPLIDSLNEFVDRVGTTAYKAIDDAWTEFRGGKGKDLVTLQRANDLAESYGLGSPYKAMEEYLLANEKFPRNLIKTSFQKANMWLATVGLRFDFANSLINIVSTPIMLGTELSSIRVLTAKDPELAGKLAELTTTRLPGSPDIGVPTTSKLLFNAIGNFFGKDKAALIQRYRDNGDIKDVATLYHEVLDDLAYQPHRAPSDWSKRVDAAIEKGAKITGNTFSEEFTRFVSADVMRQLSEPLVQAGKMTLKEQNAYISSFVNRVQGNYIYSQRPVIFQGTVGSAISLFQTYAFNVLQQLFRHVENRDRRTLAVFTGLQSTLYGFNGLPFFDAINTHLIGSAAGNVSHQDAYSFLPGAVNKELGDWMLYGTASAFPLFGEKSPALYSRGDINPRHLSIVPVNPLDVPAVSASIKLVQSLVGFGKNVANGADLSGSFLQALEHHGWNRPLAGFAQVLAGQSTTSKGSLISAANDLETTSFLARIPDRMVEFGGASRIMGAKPMDEAVALNQLYRNKAYEAMDRARIEAIGQAVKTKLAGNKMPDPEDMDGFMESYVNSGGRIETFSSTLQRWMKDSNTSIVNQMAMKLGSPYGKKMQMLMGGDMLEDYNSLAEDSTGQ